VELEFYIPGADDEKDQAVKLWWETRTGIGFSLETLSDHCYFAKQEGKGIAALSLFPMKGSSYCMVGWPIANPDTTKEERNFALNLLFDKMHLDALEMGYKRVFTTSGVEVVQERLTNFGYVLGDSNVNQYWKELQ